MTTITPYRSDQRPGPDGFAQLLHAEWTKFRTVRGWVIGLIGAIVVGAGIGLLGSGTSSSSCQQVSSGSRGPVRSGAACMPTFPLGPDGEPVTDSFYFVRQPLTGDGTVTVRVTSLTGLIPSGNLNGPSPPTRPGLEEWAKAGIIIKQNTNQGSRYAAMMVAAGHGVRMQWDYTADTPGLSGAVGPANPRWLRLTRAGDVVTGYDSADGTHWTKVGTVTLSGLPSTVQAGLFAASPASAQSLSRSIGGGSGSGALTLATARFDHLSLRGQRHSGTWTSTDVGGDPAGAPPGTGFRQTGGAVTVTGSGDIAPDVPAAGNGTPIERTLLGAFGGLIAVIVVAAMFITAEYRRGLIRVTFSARPGRGRVLAAKAVVIGSVTFAAGLAGAGAAVTLGGRLLRSNGNYVLPVSALTEMRVVAGTAALLAAAAVLALALGTILRHSAGAITAVIVTIVLPYFFATPLSVLPAGAADWLLRITPAAAFAIQQTNPQYPQVSASYTPANGYFPLAPWAGFAVLCGYAAIALALAALLLRRRDA
jgi:ABC-type transport system involved in multi-copper enzyme maturation permease subunit